MRRVLVLVAAGLFPAVSSGSPVPLTVDPARSNIEVELCVTLTSTQCDSDTSPVLGLVTISLDCLGDPTELTLYDFSFRLAEPIDLNIVFRVFGIPVGTLTATGTNIELHYAAPGTPQPPVPIVASAFSVPDTPVRATGTLAYNTTGIVCTAMQGAGRPCADTIDLSTASLAPVTLNGMVAVSGRDVTVTMDVDISTPLDPTNPGLGTLTMRGRVVSEGTVPLPDVPTFVGVLTGAITAPDLVCESDIDGDGNTDARDLQPYVEALLTP